MVGPILAILGIVVIILAAVQHFVGVFGTSIPHLGPYLAVLGVILLAIGGWMTMQARKATA